MSCLDNYNKQRSDRKQQKEYAEVRIDTDADHHPTKVSEARGILARLRTNLAELNSTKDD